MEDVVLLEDDDDVSLLLLLICAVDKAKNGSVRVMRTK